MLNKVWFGLLLIGIVYGFGKASYNSAVGNSLAAVEQSTGETGENENSDVRELAKSGVRDPRNLEQMGKDLNAAAIDAAQLSVEICLKLVGVMALWLGLLNIAKDGGLVDAFARLMRPIMRFLFPDVPDGHPAQGAMVMNISANMLGLDNAATPMGLKAMQELQTLNPEKDTATNAMATFLAINTSNVTIIPITIIAYRVAAGSEDPAGPLVPILLVTSVTTMVAVIAVRLLARSPAYAVIPSEHVDHANDEEAQS